VRDPRTATPGVVIDTSVLVDVLRGDPGAMTAYLTARRRRKCTVSTVTVAELLAGLRSGEEDALAAALDGVEVAPIDLEVGVTAGRLAATWGRSHPGIGMADHIVAATAILGGAELWTRNVRHFPMFPGLVSPY
jgi:predicted nucleic acid-binding protein